MSKVGYNQDFHFMPFWSIFIACHKMCFPVKTACTIFFNFNMFLEIVYFKTYSIFRVGCTGQFSCIWSYWRALQKSSFSVFEAFFEFFYSLPTSWQKLRKIYRFLGMSTLRALNKYLFTVQMAKTKIKSDKYFRIYWGPKLVKIRIFTLWHFCQISQHGTYFFFSCKNDLYNIFFVVICF